MNLRQLKGDQSAWHFANKRFSESAKGKREWRKTFLVIFIAICAAITFSASILCTTPQATREETLLISGAIRQKCIWFLLKGMTHSLRLLLPLTDTKTQWRCCQKLLAMQESLNVYFYALNRKFSAKSLEFALCFSRSLKRSVRKWYQRLWRDEFEWYYHT